MAVNGFANGSQDTEGSGGTIRQVDKADDTTGAVTVTEGAATVTSDNYGQTITLQATVSGDALLPGRR